MYTPIYANIFKKLRRKNLSILEIGVGGYDSPTEGGASLKMWKKFFATCSLTAAIRRRKARPTI